MLARHKDDLNTLARIGALGLDNLTIGFDNKTNTQGARLQATPNGANLGNMLCDIVHNSGEFPGASGRPRPASCSGRSSRRSLTRSVPTRRRTRASRPQLKLGGTDTTQDPGRASSARLKEGNAS